MPNQHTGKEGHKISTMMIIHAEVGENSPNRSSLIRSFLNSSPVTGVVGQTQARDLTADRRVLRRIHQN